MATTSVNRKTVRNDALGRAADGVVILRPVVRPKHFTMDQIKKTIDSIRRTGAEDAKPKTR